MNYLLDTNTVIAVLKDYPKTVRKQFAQVCAKGASLSISSIVLFELWYGVARSERRRENTDRLRTFLSGAVSVLSFEEDDAVTAGNLRRQLEEIGKPIGPYDLLIASQALRTKAVLVTANVSEFARIQDLQLQNWTV